MHGHDTAGVLPSGAELAALAREATVRSGVKPEALTGGVAVTSPINGAPLASVDWAAGGDVDAAVARARDAFTTWRATPAPVRGALVKRFGELLVEHKADLATLVSLEVGKITSEALGEVQEMIDICDFAVGLSRQLYGKTMSSERPAHRLMETWHPLGVAGVITAFNFPVAVWSWNAAIALVCGDPVIWKPSQAAPLTASGTPTCGARPTRSTTPASSRSPRASSSRSEPGSAHPNEQLAEVLAVQHAEEGLRRVF